MYGPATENLNYQPIPYETSQYQPQYQQGQYPVPQQAYAPQYGYNQPPIQQGYPLQGMQGTLMGYDQSFDLMVAQPNEKFPSVAYTRFPQEITCAQCRRNGVTTIKHKVGMGTCIGALGLWCFGCLLCSCVPFCVKDCKDVVHRCPNCGTSCGKARFLMD